MLEAISATVRAGGNDKPKPLFPDTVRVVLRFPDQCVIRNLEPNIIEITTTAQTNMVAPFTAEFIKELEVKFGQLVAFDYVEEKLIAMQRELLLKQVR